MSHVEAACLINPKRGRAVPVQFHPILIRIAQIDGFAHAMVNHSIDCDTRRLYAAESVARTPS
jgi:hypothetical protein